MNGREPSGVAMVGDVFRPEEGLLGWYVALSVAAYKTSE